MLFVILLEELWKIVDFKVESRPGAKSVDTHVLILRVKHLTFTEIETLVRQKLCRMIYKTNTLLYIVTIFR